MAKKEIKKREESLIPVKDLEVGGVYQTHVKDLVKVEKLNDNRKQVTLFNITGVFRQWTDYKNVNIIKRIY